MQQSVSQMAPRFTAPRRTLSPKQVAVQPMTPLFDACRRKGLPITEGNRLARLRAINLYFAVGELPFNWLVTSFKELLADPGALLVVVDAVNAEVLKW